MDRTYLEYVTEAQTVEEVWTLHSEKMLDYGFDRLIYGFTRFMSSNSLGDPDDLLILSNHDPEYMDAFISEQQYHHAPMVKWARENTGACSWGWMKENARMGGFTESEKRVFELNQRMEVTSGYTVSFKSVSSRARGAIALTARRGLTQDSVDSIWEKHGRDIIVMNNVAHLKIITLPYTSKRSLTKRQREALEWVGDGKTTQDIAMIMGLTQATIEKHLRLAREALDVETTAQAVLKASVQNQIFIVDV
ncbi:LuxR family transcriptional regulator [Algirhabdus cladophorae]|uniref:LuxR family transcriptional regulator n=1 Tax=Algirhabdus cladophorae TaxID=3377108 RepID=UPI003B84954D